MKVYISVDIEGVAGITDWNEAEKAHADLRTISPKALFPCRRGFALVIINADPVTAYRMSWYPGAGHVGDRAIRYETTNYLDILRMLNFAT